MFRHERMTVGMALAEFSHHSSRGQRMARAGVWGHEQNYTAKIRKPPTPQPELFSLEEEPGGGLPAPLSEVAGKQEKVERHFVEHLAEFAPHGANPRCPCAAGRVETLQRHLADPGFPDCRAGYRCAQDLLLSVSITFSFLFLSRSQWNSWWKCRPCCLPPASPCGSRSRSSTLVFFVVVVKVFSQNRVQQRRLLLAKRISERTVEQIVDISSSGGGLGQGSSSSAGPADEDFTGGFRTFPHGKKCGVPGML